MPYSYQVVMLTGDEEQSSKQSLNESILPLLQKVVGFTTLSNAPVEHWLCDNLIKLLRSVSLSCFSLVEAQS